MAEFWVYVLESEKDGMRYTGHTQDIDARLKRHNLGEYRFTKGHRPWKVLYKESVGSRSEAVKRERLLKSGVGRKLLNEVLMS